MKKRLISTIFVTMFVLLLFSIKVNAENSTLKLNELDFNVNINQNGSMDIIETWNISIKNTNTLYKTFKKDKSKYTSITNVKVKDLTSNKEFTQINQEMYHVTKDCYYGLENSKGKYEIAWGVGLDNSCDTRKYEISYTVNDAIAKYNDYAELYWQFVGADFEIDADKIKGIIKLPKKVEKLDNFLVWGHTENLNGEIYVIDNETAKFQINNFDAGRYVEVRTLFPSNIVESSGRTYSKDIYNTVINEETKWAKEANIKREWENKKDYIIGIIYFLIILILCIIYILKTVKYAKKLLETKKFESTENVEYYRELPYENATPGEAVYILKEPYNTFDSYYGKIFSATLLNLKLKNCIDLRAEKNKIYIKIIRRENSELKDDERNILSFISDAFKTTNEIEIRNLEKFIKNNSSKVLSLISISKNKIQLQLKEQNIFDNKEYTQYKNYEGFSCMYYVFGAITVPFAFPLSIILLTNGILCTILKRKSNVLTQDGVNIKSKWQGLKKYMEDFSLLDEKEIPAIEFWEHYLVYATAFGIANKVLKQLKKVYPHIDELDTMNTSTYLNFMYHCNFASSFSSAINSSISSSYSSGTGGGGGFSGGGGGGRRPEVVEAEDKP